MRLGRGLIPGSGCGAFLHQLPVLEIDGIGPSEADHVLLIARAHLHVGVARDHVVFLANGAVFSKALVDGRIDFVVTGEALYERIRT